MIALKCISCGAPLSDNLKCEYCGTRYQNETNMEINKNPYQPTASIIEMQYQQEIARQLLSMFAPKKSLLRRLLDE